MEKKHVPNISKPPASYYFDLTITKHNHRLRRVAQAIPALEQRHAVALRLQLSGGADAAHAGAHHDHVLFLAGRKEGLDSEIWAFYPLANSHIANWKITMLLMGKSTISMAIFNSYVSLPEGIWDLIWVFGFIGILHGLFVGILFV